MYSSTNFFGTLGKDVKHTKFKSQFPNFSVSWSKSQGINYSFQIRANIIITALYG